MSVSSVNFTSKPHRNSSYMHSLIEETTILDLCIYFINPVFGLPTHSYVLWLIVRGSSGAASEFFSLNLCEIGTCLNSFFNVLNYFTEFLHLKRLAWFLLGLIVTGRAVFQCLMCVERYLAVVHPVTFLKYKPLRYRLIFCAVAWIFTLGSCLCCMYTIEQFHFHIYIHFFSIQFLVFLSIQLFCLVAVLRALQQSGPGERKREKEENLMKRRAFYLILITTVTMFVIYTPLLISGFLFILMHLFINNLFSFGFSCFVLAGFVQPVLYLQRSGKLFCICSP